MSTLGDELPLLDTNIIIHLARDDDVWRAANAEYGLLNRREVPLLSSVVEGEVLGLAMHWGWGESRKADLVALFDEFVRVDVGLPEVVQEYARLYSVSASAGRLPGENDLWILATASAAGAVIYTCDTDFDWFDPDYVRVRRAPTAP